jgi:hypothetical protein
MSMPTVHEDVHQRAGEDQQIRERPEEMGGVLGHEVKPRDREKADQNDPSSRRKKTTLRILEFVVLHIMLHRSLLMDDRMSAVFKPSLVRCCLNDDLRRCVSSRRPSLGLTSPRFHNAPGASSPDHRILRLTRM